MSQHRGRVEKMRVGIPALFTVEVDYYKDLENVGPTGQMSTEEEIKYWLSKGRDPYIMNPKLPLPRMESSSKLLPLPLKTN
ncbi:MAG TPA: hypothetical protein EYG21_03435 [Nitrospinaceae bacterium]|nr:hypothetical protein [Nitrospinaceae bacterium]